MLNDLINSKPQPNDYILIPLISDPGQFQQFSFNQEMSYELYPHNSMYIYFTRMDGKIISQSLSTPLSFLPQIQFTFIEGKHTQ